MICVCVLHPHEQYLAASEIVGDHASLPVARRGKVRCSVATTKPPTCWRSLPTACTPRCTTLTSRSIPVWRLLSAAACLLDGIGACGDIDDPGPAKFHVLRSRMRASSLYSGPRSGWTPCRGRRRWEHEPCPSNGNRSLRTSLVPHVKTGVGSAGAMEASLRRFNGRIGNEWAAALSAKASAAGQAWTIGRSGAAPAP